MKHIIRVLPVRLSDGSTVYNVTVQIEGEIHAIDETHALELVEKMSRAITDHSVDEVETLWNIA